MYIPEEGELVIVRVQDRFDMEHMTSGRYTGVNGESGENFEIDLVDSPFVDKSTVVVHKEDVYEATEENRNEYL